MTRGPKLGRGRDRPLTRTTVEINASPERVFSVMSDAWLLATWVVGATHIRDVDDEWPAPGAKVRHQVGAWPFTISDVTAVVECEEPRRFVLQGRAFPFGEAYIDLTVEADGDGCEVIMAEAPSYGPARILDNPVQRRLLEARNRESLARLRAIAEHRREISIRTD